MKLTVKFLTLFLFVLVLIPACKKEDKHHEPSPSNDEYKYIRLLVSDASSKTISHIDPVAKTSQEFEASFPNATLHSTDSKRFGALIFGSENQVQFFDCGFEYHGDHVDMKGTPKFAAISADGVKPTHFKSRGEEVLIFNDGDGTLSVAHEHDFHIAGEKMHIIDAGLAPHHGAMAQFDNGLYAVTFPDPLSSLSGPHGVKIINAEGQEVHASTLPVSRIHGNATDGTNALFGVAGGILVVNKNGEQRIISNPDGFGDVRIGTVLEARGVNKFIGYTNAKGAYFINLGNNKIEPIIESTEIMQCKVDYAGKNLIVLHLNGDLKIIDLSTGTIKKEGNVIGATSSSEAIKPVVEATSKYVYIAVPSAGEINKINVSDFNDAVKIKVTPQPAKMTILGYESNESH